MTQACAGCSKGLRSEVVSCGFRAKGAALISAWARPRVFVVLEAPAPKARLNSGGAIHLAIEARFQRLSYVAIGIPGEMPQACIETAPLALNITD